MHVLVKEREDLEPPILRKARMTLLRPIYTVRFLLTIVACDFCSARCSRHEKIAYDFHDIKLPVATIVVGF